jgi:hypothetical protein
MILEAFTDYADHSEESNYHKANAVGFHYLPINRQENLDLVLKILERNGLVLGHLKEEQRNDPKFALVAIKNNYHAYMNC